MENTYGTSEVARMIGIHPNTVRLYEELGLIPKPVRKSNGYRVFTDFHVEQFKLARAALRIEVLQNGLRKMAIEIIKISAAGEFDKALLLTECYLRQIKREQRNAEEAIEIAEQLINGGTIVDEQVVFTRKETADRLQLTMDSLRNWEMNGLLAIKRKHNGYRVYTEEDVRLLKIIRALRCANYSLAAILRMLNALSKDPQVDIRAVIDTPKDDEDIFSACDKLLTSLNEAGKNGQEMRIRLTRMKVLFQ